MCNVMFKVSRQLASPPMQVYGGDTQGWRLAEVQWRTGEILLAEKEKSNDAYTRAIF
jgi:hypothetical protein